MTKSLQNSKALGFGSLDAQSLSIDWQAAFGEDLDGCEVIMPTLTLGDVDERAPDLLSAAQKRAARVNPHKPTPQPVADAFNDSDSRYEWEDSFRPVMNYVYPVFIYEAAGRPSPQAVADRLEQFAPACSLIYFGEHSDHCPEEYGFALTGGGMDLSDHIAAAYLCADQVPPTWILQRLAGVGMSERKLASIGASLRVAYRMATRAMRDRAKDLAQESARIFKQQTKGGAQS